MYRDTTSTQVLRAVGVWVVCLAGASLFFVGAQVFVRDNLAAPIVVVLALATGIALVWWAKRRLAALDTANRPYLLSEEGSQAMRHRQDVERTIVVARRWALAGFVVLACAFIVLVSYAACVDRVDGICSTDWRPTFALVQATQLGALAMAGLWVALMSLKSTHAKESERIDRVVAEGQRRRRNDHPFAGMSRSGWE